MKQPTILITAYAAHPGKGSEDGTGWNIIRELAGRFPVIAITRRNNRAAIESFRAQVDPALADRLQFEYFDLPPWLSFWKRGSRGALLYHYLWHLAVVWFIRRRGLIFDIAHHLNFHSDWSPSFLWLLGQPVVWGPVGHHPPIPRTFLSFYGRKAWLSDRLRWAAKQLLWGLDPFLRLSRQKAEVIFGVNSQVAGVLGLAPERVSLLPAVAAPAQEAGLEGKSGFEVLSIGRFVPLKGFDLTIESFARFYEQQAEDQRSGLRLTLIGKGPELRRLQALAADRLPAEAYRFIQWLDQSALAAHFREADVFLFPSHEGAGMVVCEALSYGLPIVCFDNAGPGELAGPEAALLTPMGLNREQAIDAFSRRLEELYRDQGYRLRVSDAAVQRHRRHFTWAAKADRIQEQYLNILNSHFPNHYNDFIDHVTGTFRSSAQ